jgi:predicted N-acetyltransferase YhbS
VDPKYQKRGAGKLLVQWGTKLADEMGAEAIVEASPAGRYLYEQNGFVFRHEVTLQVPEKWEHKPKQSFLWMVRPARTESKSELQE